MLLLFYHLHYILPQMYVIHFSLPVMTTLAQALIFNPEQPITELPNSYLVTSAIQPFIPLQKPNTKLPQDTIPLLKTFIDSIQQKHAFKNL